MTTRGFSSAVMRLLLVALGAAQGLLLAPSWAGADGLVIDHKPVKCIVVGKFAKLSSCYVPASQLARGRLYFRPEGVTIWYYVDAIAEAPCHAALLPKATRKLLGKHLEYYVQGVDTSFLEAQSEQYQALYVASEQDCKNQPVAAIASKGPVAVFPTLPANMIVASGFPTLAVASGVAVAGGTTAVLASRGDTTTSSTQNSGTPPGGVTPPPPANPPPPPVPPPPPPPAPEVRCVPAFSVNPDPPEGYDPLEVTFDMCATTGGHRKFFFDFNGDGTVDLRGSRCSASKIYTVSGVAGRGTTSTPFTVSYFPTITGGCDDVGVFESRTYEVKVTSGRPLTVKALDGPAPVRRLALSSQLDVPQGRGQVVVNGSSVVYTPFGRSMAVAQGRRGDNRVEAQLVQGAGPGTWRFDLGATGTFEPGSLRVIAGEVVVVSADAVVFRLNGKPGERLVFAFRAGR